MRAITTRGKSRCFVGKAHVTVLAACINRDLYYSRASTAIFITPLALSRLVDRFPVAFSRISALTPPLTLSLSLLRARNHLKFTRISSLEEDITPREIRPALSRVTRVRERERGGRGSAKTQRDRYWTSRSREVGRNIAGDYFHTHTPGIHDRSDGVGPRPQKGSVEGQRGGGGTRSRLPLGHLGRRRRTGRSLSIFARPILQGRDNRRCSREGSVFLSETENRCSQLPCNARRYIAVQPDRKPGESPGGLSVLIPRYLALLSSPLPFVSRVASKSLATLLMATRFARARAPRELAFSLSPKV